MKPGAAAAPRWMAGLAHFGMLDRQISLAVLRAFALMAAGLTAMLTLLDFVQQLAIVGQEHYRAGNALVDVLLNAPGRLLQVTPVSLLLGSLLALGTMNRNAELTAIRCCGISETRIIGAVLRLVVPVGISWFLLTEFTIPRTQLLAQDLRAAALSRDGETSFWAHGDGRYLSIGRFDRDHAYGNVEIFEFDDHGDMTSYIHGDRATVRPDGAWLLGNVVIKRVAAGVFHTEQLNAFNWRSFISADDIGLLRLPLDSMPPIKLYRYVHRLSREHQPANRLERALCDKLVFPLSMVAMILIATPFVFGPARSRSAGTQVVLGAAIGIVFTLCQQIVPRAGALLDMSPMLGALASPVLFAALAVYLFRRSL